MYPASALVGNWLVLGTLITPLQGLGCLLLIATILVLSWAPARVRTQPVAMRDRTRAEARPHLQATTGSSV